MREQLAWFVAGAMLATVGVLVFTHDSGASGPRFHAPSDDARVAQRLEAIERTLAVLAREQTAGNADSATERRTESSEPPVPVSAVSVSAAERGGAIVDGAVAAGYWSRKDAQEFMAVAGHMSAEDQLALIGKLSAAINADRVKVEAGVLPR